MCEFRILTKDDVELRVSRAWATKGGAPKCSLLVYKDARVDRSILNEAVGKFGWQSEFELINGSLFCKVSIKNPEGQWITKMDVGTESNTEKEKGQASDAFKRACFAWGIGEELYSAPDVSIELYPDEYSTGGNDKYGNPTIRPYNNLFSVARMDVDPKTRKITALVIIDKGTQQHRQAIRYEWTSKPRQLSRDDYNDFVDGRVTEAELNNKYYITRKGWESIRESITNK